jgi:hypothetical protein
MADASLMTGSMRGIGWDYGARPDQLPAAPPQRTIPFLRVMASRIIFYHVVTTLSACVST